MLFPSYGYGERMNWNIGDTLLGKYRVERLLGQGGMGVVLAARHIELGELYAIKMMHTRLPTADDAAGRFVREARASARLKGDHVARVHDVGRTDEGDLYMVMEYLEGMDLKTYLAQNGRLPMEEAVDYILQACDGIGEAHEAGIVHRDIKPANLFLLRKRKTGQSLVKVVDFGISKNLNPGEGTELTQSGTMLGSPLYMSPEQMQYAHQVDSRTDIWSLGVVLYELITGKVPFPGDTMTQVVHGVMHLEPKSVRFHVPTVPPSLDAVIAQCLRKDAEQRFATIDALILALRTSLKSAAEEEVGPAVTIKEKPVVVSLDAALDATAPALPFEPTVATPAPVAKHEPIAPMSTGTEMAEVRPNKTEASPTLPLSKTLESATTPIETSTQDVSVNSPQRSFSRFAFILIFAVLGIGVYWATYFSDSGAKPAASAASNGFNSTELPKASAVAAVIDAPMPSSSSAPEALIASAIALQPSMNAPVSSPALPTLPKSIGPATMPAASSVVLPPPMPPSPPSPPSLPASPSVPRWNGPL